MLCWSKSEISFVGQMFFIGSALSIILIWGPESMGRSGFVKKVIIPMQVAVHFLEVLFPLNYALNCLAYFIYGLVKIGNLVNIQNCTEQLPASHLSIISGFIFLLQTAAVFLFSAYIQTLANDAVQYVHAYGYLALVMALGFVLVASESPKWLLMNGRREEAIKSLRYIAKVNSALSLSTSRRLEISQNSQAYFGEDSSTLVFLDPKSLEDFKANEHLLLVDSPQEKTAREKRGVIS